MRTDSMTTTSETPLRERRGNVEQFHMNVDGGHAVHYDADTDFSFQLQTRYSEVGGAEGGYLLVRFDVDEEPFSVVHVNAPGGWWPVDGKSPANMIHRGAAYPCAH